MDLCYFGPAGSTDLEMLQAPSDDKLATRMTLAQMGKIIRKEARTPQVQAAVEQAGANQRISRSLKARRIWEWITQHVEFASDNRVLAEELGLTDARDMIITPSRLLTMPAPKGDCDCQTTLCGAMLTCAGVPLELVATKSSEQEPWRYSHTFLQYTDEAQNRYALDCSHGLYPGWEVPRQYGRTVSNLDGQEINPPMPLAIDRYGNRVDMPASNGLGAADDYGGDTGSDWDYYTATDPIVSSSPVYLGTSYDRNGNYIGTPAPKPSAPSAWDKVFQSLAITGGQLALQTTQKPGQYTQTAAGVMSYTGSAPSALSLGGASISPTLLIAGAVGVGLLVMFGGKK